jgi:phage terminase small subunit
MKTKGRKLTRKQRFFVAELQKDWNATQAAIRAGYNPKNLSRASEIGYQLLQKTPVKEALQRDVDERLRRLGHRADATIEGLLKVANFDIRKLFNPDWTLKKPDELDDDTVGALAGLEVVELFEGKGDERVQIGFLKKVRTADRVEALVTLAKIQKLLRPDTQNTANVIIIEAGRVTKPFNAGMSED